MNLDCTRPHCPLIQLFFQIQCGFELEVIYRITESATPINELSDEMKGDFDCI